MSRFRIFVEKTTNTFKKHSYTELLHIFNIKADLTERLDLDISLPLLSKDIFDRLLKLIKNNQYSETTDGIFVTVNPERISFFLSKNSNYGKSSYNPKTKLITCYCSDIKAIDTDMVFRSNCIHEITHALSDYIHTEMTDYIIPKTDRNKYFLQPAEIEANFVSACDFFVKYLTFELKNTLLPKEINNKVYIQARIDEYLHEITKYEYMLYKDFLNALSKDKELFTEFYETLLKGCYTYITQHLQEVCENSVINKWKDEGKKYICQ